MHNNTNATGIARSDDTSKGPSTSSKPTDDQRKKFKSAQITRNNPEPKSSLLNRLAEAKAKTWDVLNGLSKRMARNRAESNRKPKALDHKQSNQHANQGTEPWADLPGGQAIQTNPHRYESVPLVASSPTSTHQSPADSSLPPSESQSSHIQNNTGINDSPGQEAPSQQNEVPSSRRVQFEKLINDPQRSMSISEALDTRTGQQAKGTSGSPRSTIPFPEKQEPTRPATSHPSSRQSSVDSSPSASKSHATKVIIITGVAGAGKSTFINLAAGKPLTEVEHGIESHTNKNIRTKSVEWEGQKYRFIETPGFDHDDKGDEEVMAMLDEEIRKACDGTYNLETILYFHPISSWMNGSQRSYLESFKNLCKMNKISRVVFVTTMWDKVPPENAAQAQNALKEERKRYGKSKNWSVRAFKEFDSQHRRDAWRIINPVSSAQAPQNNEGQFEKWFNRLFCGYCSL